METKEIEETLMALVPESDFEKLLFAEKYIESLKRQVKELSIRIGILQSDLDEITDSDNFAKKYLAMKNRVDSLIRGKAEFKHKYKKVIIEVVILKIEKNK